MSSTTNFSQIKEKNQELVHKLKEAIADSDTILIGAGSGLSTSAGLEYSGERFEKCVGDFGKHYGFQDMYSGGFHDYPSLEAHWGYWSQQIYHNRITFQPNKVYENLRKITENKDYFVITTNVDHLFQKSGFEKEKLFYTQGDYGSWQCSVPCHREVYDNEEEVLKMIEQQKDFCIPSELVPYCPKCGKPMTMHLRKDNAFVENEQWQDAYGRYAEFLVKYQDKKILLLELGVGGNTPVIIKYPFWDYAKRNSNAIYSCINLDYAIAPSEIRGRSICISDNIAEILNAVAN